MLGLNAGALIRERGYEALFLLGGALAIAARPTNRTGQELERYFMRDREKRVLEGLRVRGLVAHGGDALLLTGLGRVAMAGGRLPDEAWTRPWDQFWRMIAFDLPEKPRNQRSRFWRWLRANHFGNLQGSLWITPDPVPAIEKVVQDFGFDPSAALVCTGQISGKLSPREVAAKAWDFTSINERYRSYAAFAEITLKRVQKRPLPEPDLKPILADDRQLWWSAVEGDPLLPKSLAPGGYEGPATWKLRQRLHKTLLRSLQIPH